MTVFLLLWTAADATATAITGPGMASGIALTKSSGLAEHRAQVLEIDAARRQGLRINPDGRLLLTSDPHESDPGYLRDLLQQNVFRQEGGTACALRSDERPRPSP
jgi:hypothetical protein